MHVDCTINYIEEHDMVQACCHDMFNFVVKNKIYRYSMTYLCLRTGDVSWFSYFESESTMYIVNFEVDGAPVRG